MNPPSIIFSIDFIQNLLLLIVGAALSGFLIPYVLKRIDDNKLDEQKKTEAALARQSKIIESQSKFLDDISQLLWEWRYLCVRLTYYAGNNDDSSYEMLREKYETNKWDVFHRVRVEVSRARRLVSEQAYRKLLNMYKDLVEIDKKITAIDNEDKETRWISYRDMNQFLYQDVTEEVDQLLYQLSIETQLNNNKITK